MAKGRFSNPFSAVFTGVHDVLRRKDNLRDFKVDENLKEKTCLVTGANSGLGFGISVLLAKREARVIMACRSGIPSAGEKVKRLSQSSNVQMLNVDLTKVESINKFVVDLVKNNIKLDVAIFNAGITPPKARKTSNGLDEMFMVNYLSKFYLVNELIKNKIISYGATGARAVPRIIFISSDSHQKASPIEINQLGEFENYAGPSRAVSLYSYYKLVLNTFAVELSRRINSTGAINYSVQVVCPGPVNSNIIRDAPIWMKVILKFVFWLFFKSPLTAAEPVLYLAMAEEMEGTTSQYLHMKNPKRMDEKVYDPETGKKLWDKSEALISRFYK
jgi:NAD(P)-dependent dehydrogenase (short-subunit alcohol dehydrogenase family)